jgi:GNAT superfamily N-acetyltransferase
MNGMAISLKLDPSAAEIDQVLQPLVRFNWAAHDTPQNFQPFILELAGPGGDVVGGLVGMAEWDWLLLQYVFVPEALRGEGYGTALMRRAEDFARKRSLLGVWSNMFGFQPVSFFEKLGYGIVATIEDHPKGSCRHIIRKRF